MTQIAERLHVREFGLQFRPDLNRRDVIGMQMTAPVVIPLPQLFENHFRRQVSQLVLAKLRDDIRLPAASDTAPMVPLETKNPETAVLLAVPALDRGASLLCELAPMNQAARTVRQIRAKRLSARLAAARVERHRSLPALELRLLHR